MATTVQNPFDTQQPAATKQNTTTGLVASALPPANTVATYDPQTRQVNAPTETVQGQVNSILSKDSPLMQRARTLATQGMAQRGLVNSSMAQGAGVAAMTDRALPMAQQDAQTYAATASENMGATNRANEFGAGAINQFGLQKSDQTFQNEQLQKQQQFTTSERVGSQGFTSGLEQSRQNFAGSQAALDRSQQTDLTKLQQTFTGAQSALERAQQAYLQDKSAANQMALQNAQQVFTGAQSALDRTQQGTILDKQAAIQKDLTVQQQNFAGAQAALDRAQQTYLTDKTAANQMALQNAQQVFTGAQANLERTQQLKLQDDQQTFQTSMTQMQQTFAAAQSGLDRQQQIFLQNDAQEFQKNLTNSQIPANFALSISNTTSSSINSIAADPNLSGTVDNKEPAGSSPKSRAINSVINYANSQITWANKFYGTTIPGLPIK